jgi:phosphatidylserine decarboxylase
MIHKEGTATLLGSAALFILITLFLQRFTSSNVAMIVGIVLFAVFLFLISFFRNPNRKIEKLDDQLVYAPADGKVVVIEETEETEYLKGKALQVSIFMSPLNVHVNRNPISGKITYYKYHPGKFLPAWEPKASTENERTTIVYEGNNGLILMRQIAGALAKRIVCYAKTGETIVQGEDIGFIKFGSRVDMYFPIGTKINVQLGEVVMGNQTVVAEY